MSQHTFLLTDGKWLGQGVIQIAAVPEPLLFYTRWTVTLQKSHGYIVAVQEIELSGMLQKTVNQFTLHYTAQNVFAIQYSNQYVTAVTGEGQRDFHSVQWQWHAGQEVQGQEIYQLQPNGNYLCHAQFSANHFTTEITYHLWLVE